MNKFLGLAFAGFAVAVGGASNARASAVKNIDLTCPGSSAHLNDGALFCEVKPKSCNSDTFQSIVSLHPKCDSTTEAGYNTDGRGPIFNHFDADSNPKDTHSIKLNQLGSQEIGNTCYHQFLLDLNEPKGCKSTIELTDLKIYLGCSPSELKCNPDALGTKVWDLDAKKNVTLDLKDNNHHGVGDYLLSIPDCLFKGCEQNVYLYSKFECAQGGCEDWCALTPPNCHAAPLPPAAYTGLATMAVFGAGYGLRKRRALAV